MGRGLTGSAPGRRRGAISAKSLLGAVAAAFYAGAFAVAYFEYVRASGQWPDGEWLFLVALPYTLSMMRLIGSVDFSGDSIESLLFAAAFGCVLAYVAGALIEAIARTLVSGARRIIRAT
jgi:hypothetical protein